MQLESYRHYKVAPVGFVYCFLCSCRRMTVARNRTLVIVVGRLEFILYGTLIFEFPVSRFSERKRKRSDSSICQKSLNHQKIKKKSNAHAMTPPKVSIQVLFIHICTYCDTFLCKETTCVSHVNGKSDIGYEKKIPAVLNNRKKWFFLNVLLLDN